MSRRNRFDEYPSVMLPPKKKTPEKETPVPNRSGEGQIPWLYIAYGGGGAWIVVVLIIAAFSIYQNNSAPVRDDPLPMPAIRPIAPQIVAAPKPAAQVPVAELPPLEDEDFVDCAAIGTDVRFVKDPADAFKHAAAQKKMVFMVHLSGNLEDKDFT